MKKVAVVGSANMDLLLTVNRFPEAGETVLGQNYQYNFGGKGSNQAIQLNRLKTPVKLFVRLGKDDNGRKIEANFNAEKLATEIAWSDLHSGFATIINFQNDNRIMVFSGSNMETNSEYEEQIQSQLDDFDLILLQCEIAPQLNMAIAKWAHEHDKKVILNPAPVDKLDLTILPYIDYLLPNETEATFILEKVFNFDPKKLITTRGKAGASYQDQGQEKIVPPLNDLKVADTTGAGDAFVAGFVYGLAHDYSIEKSIRCGNITGGKNTEQLGATPGMINEKTLKEILDAQS